jgi:hypothetical protein
MQNLKSNSGMVRDGRYESQTLNAMGISDV